MRKFTFKTLLVTAALCLSTSAFAALEEVWSIDFTSIGANYANKTTVTIDAASPILSMGPISVNGEEIDNKFLLQTQTNWMFMVANGLYQYNSGGRSFGLADCKAGQIISIETTGGVPTVNTNVSLMSSEGTSSVFSVLADGAVKFNLARYCYIRTIKVEENVVSEDAKPTKYTLKYEDENGSELKSIQIDSYVGEIVTATSLDIASFFYNEQKYIYKSGNEEISLVEDPIQNVITLVFREAGTYSYTINAIDTNGEKLKELTTGSNFEGEKSRAYVTKGLNIDGVWYITSGNSSYPTYGYDFTEAATKNVTYTVDENVDYFFEVEDINKSRSWAATGAYPERYSNGLAGRFYKGAYAYTDALAGGIYKITMWARNNSGSQIANVGLYYRDSEGNATSLGVSFEDWTAGKSESKTIENVIIPDGASLMLKNENPDYNSNLEMDYLILQKTGDATVSTTITSAGYATFSSTYAVDFSKAEGLAAYTAKVNDGNKTITLTKIADGIVPANTGVVLKGAAGEYTGTITTTDATVDNDLIANNAEITSDGTIYVLNKVGENVGFYPLAEGKTLAAGKAYLQLASGAKGYSFVWNDGETTGIEENYEFGTMNSDAATYDLSGRKVANPAKGLYIKNGKKFIVK